VKVVSNAGPLIVLGKLGRLDILQKLYETILVAQEVYEETVVSGIALGAPDAYLIRDYFLSEMFKKKQVQAIKLQNETEIEEGEKATIELALSEKADFVLIDDATARKVAKRYGLKPKGTLAVLLYPNKSGLQKIVFVYGSEVHGSRLENKRINREP